MSCHGLDKAESCRKFGYAIPKGEQIEVRHSLSASRVAQKGMLTSPLFTFSIAILRFGCFAGSESCYYDNHENHQKEQNGQKRMVPRPGSHLRE